MKALATCHTFVFNKARMTALFLNNFKMPNIALYDRKQDLAVHVEVFLAYMDFERVSKLTRCWAFLLTLLGLV